MSQSNPLLAQLQRKRVLIARIVVAVLVLYLFAYKRIPVIPLGSGLGLAGIAVLFLGVLIRSLSAGVLQKNDVLAVDGIYAIVRNPLYLGSLVILLGVNILIANPLALVVTVALFLITYIPTILREEGGLAYAYGESWHAYTRRTPRLLPNPLRLGALRQVRWSLRQWRKNHEHNTVLAALLLLLLLHLYGRFVAVR